jgi:DNA-binding IclR family transcriptional regulator
MNNRFGVANNSRRKTVQSLERGLEVLSVVSTAGQPVGITDLSRRLGLAKGSIARLVATLVEQNCLVRDPEAGKYRLGMKIWELGHRALAGLDLHDIARPAMAQLHAETRDTVHLSVLTDAGDMVFLDKIDSTKGIRPDTQLGAHLPPHAVANGKAVLAFRPKAEIDKILSGKLRRYTEFTIVGKNELRTALDEIRHLGYAVNYGEYRADVSGVAAPILNHTGMAVAALGVSLPTPAVKRDLAASLAHLVVKSARDISLALGHRTDGASGD